MAIFFPGPPSAKLLCWLLAKENEFLCKQNEMETDLKPFYEYSKSNLTLQTSQSQIITTNLNGQAH